MKKSLLQRTIIIAIVTLAAIYTVFGPRHRPTARDLTWEGVQANLRNNIRLGLDLRGGSHLAMRVRTGEYLQRLTAENARAVEEAARAAGHQVREVRLEIRGDDYRIVLEANDASKVAEIRDAIPQKDRKSTRLNSSHA